MTSIPRLQAVHFHRMMSSGRTTPGLFDCQSVEGVVNAYVVKFRSKSAVLREHFAATLGKLLKIPIPPTAIVSIDAQFAALDPALTFLATDPGPHFASEHLTGGYNNFSGAYAPPETLLPQVIDIFAWDMLIQNADRRKGNSNLLFDGQRFAVIDHELALSFELLIGALPPPWELKNSRLAKDHIFFAFLHSKIEERSFDPFLARFATVSDSILEEIIQQAPAEWHNARFVSKALEHLRQVRDNLDRFKRGLVEVFT